MSAIHRILMASLTAIAFTIVLMSAAFAHAEFASSVPAPRSVVSSVPSVVKATFTEGVNPKGSSFTVVGPNGTRADQGDGHVDLNDPNRTTMLVSLKPGLGPGTYTVHWTTVSAADGDTASDTFTFTVSMPSGASSGSTTSVTSLPRSGGVPVALVLVGGLAVLGAGVVLRRRAR